ncbi:MAG: aminoacyl--tRNA ligase-related protein [bacterium]|nr:aminoacyl--tRNA ligase-related protein [bacterium]
MLQSQLFYKTLKEAPKDAGSLSHAFLIRAGFIDQVSAGIYSFLPLGLRVIKKIEQIIREEMVSIGGQELLMPALTPKDNWQKTGRWETFDVLFKLKAANDREYALGATHEEIVSPLAKKYIFSYKDLPLGVFQIQTKFRNELRAKSGILRTREFLMKDLYSFHVSEEDLDKYYEKAAKAYAKVYKRCGIAKETFKTMASGGSFSKYSHEYQTVTDAGEDIIYICKKCKTGVNKEVFNPLSGGKCPQCGAEGLEEKKAIEVGNIFKLGTKYSAPFELNFKDKDGQEKPVIMGCYGIGISRLLGTIVEINNDEKGIVWPKEVSPFNVHIVQIESDKKVKSAAKKIYEDLQKRGIETLYDDRENVSAGQKLAESDLIGIFTRIIVSKRTLEKNSVEIKQRNKSKSELLKIKSLFKDNTF